jgi:hypothetical protein
MKVTLLDIGTGFQKSKRGQLDFKKYRPVSRNHIKCKKARAKENHLGYSALKSAAGCFFSVHCIPEKKGFGLRGRAPLAHICVHTHTHKMQMGQQTNKLGNANKFFAPPFAVKLIFSICHKRKYRKTFCVACLSPVSAACVCF